MHVELSPHGPVILDADNCRELDVIAPLADHAEIALRLGEDGFGRWFDQDTIALSVPKLFALASTSSDLGADWLDRWRSMLEYALSKGWLDLESDEVLAHLSDTPAASDR